MTKYDFRYIPLDVREAVFAAMPKEDLGVRLPAAVAASSPVVDFSGRVWRNSFVQDSDMPHIAQAYLGGYDEKNPYVSPIYGDFTGFPPLLLQAGSLEDLKYDSMYLGKALENTEVDCTVSIWEGAQHAMGLGPLEDWHSMHCMYQIVGFLAEKAGM